MAGARRRVPPDRGSAGNRGWSHRVFGDHTIAVSGKIAILKKGRQPQLRFSLAVGLRRDRRPPAARCQPGDASCP